MLATRFETERQRILNQAVQVGAMLAAVLVPFFGLLDYVSKPYLFETYVRIRVVVLMIVANVMLLTRTTIGRKKPYLLGAFLTMAVSGSIGLMCRLDQGPVDPYYAGINLPVLGFGILLPTTLAESLSVFVIAWLSYAVPNVLSIRADQVPVFINNNFFMVSTILISFVASQFHLHYRMREWYSHFKLEKAHRKIQSHSRELEQKVKERTRKLLQSERLAVVGQMAGGIAHDFNNHLTAIMGVSELLLYSPSLSKNMKQDIGTIFGASKRATELVKQLLAFSRQQILTPKELDLNHAVNDVRNLLLRLIGEDIELSIQTTAVLHTVKVDPVQAEQILLNLAINSRDAMPDGGKLIIETMNVKLEKAYLKARQLTIPPGDYVMLAVSDNGIGMDEEVKSKIFEPYFTTKENGKGTGLGLSTVYGIVKQSHGDILVYSEVGVGTTIKVFLPGLMEKIHRSVRGKTAVKLPKGKETILLVEDEDTIRDLTTRLLKQQGYRVIPACEGNEALNKAGRLKCPIDLLMTDVVMPNMNGRELAERLQQVYADMKVLYFSGYTDSFILKKGIIKPSNPFLQKPFTFEDLSRKVREVIDN
ncbi:MAG TPA: response regulator [bacterium]